MPITKRDKDHFGGSSGKDTYMEAPMGGTKSSCEAPATVQGGHTEGFG